MRVLVVDDHALEGQLAQGILRPEMEVVHAASLDEARARLAAESFDFVIGDEGRLRSILDGIFAFVGLFSLDGVVVDVNRVPLVASGLVREEVVGRRFVDLPWLAHSPAERDRVAEALARAARGERMRFETTIRRDGELVHVDAALCPLRDSTGLITHVVGTGVDITARKNTEFPEGVGQKFHLAYERAMAEQQPVQLREYYPPWGRWFENRIYPAPDGLSIFFTDVTEEEETRERLRVSTDQLRALAARLDAIREEERRLMAREIHDQIGQALTALKLDLAGLRARLPGGDEEVATRAGEMDRLIDQTLETTRRLSTALRPPILDDLGLGAAIAWQAREFESRTGIRCTVALDDAAAIDGAGALALFRIVQEALTNVARHAGARAVKIDLVSGEREAVLSVSDDGRGITAEETTRPEALGLAGMRERALVVGGAVEVRGTPGAGTTVTARVPRRT
jgi:PAS domain S-box-containing protein